MAVPNSNVKFTDIQTEFGGSNPISISEYYKGGSFVKSYDIGVASVPTSGAISVSNFRGASKYTPIERTQAFTSSTSWTVPDSFQGSTIQVLVVGGGGAGGNGGGGAGGVAYHSSISVSVGQTYTVTVGAGGSPNNGYQQNDSSGTFLVWLQGSSGSNGNDSVFSGAGGTLTAYGGGGGGYDQVNGNSGGSGGGAGIWFNSGGAATAASGGTTNYGNSGGSSNGRGGNNTGNAGGGGGASTAGTTGVPNNSPKGVGGNGVTLLGYTVAGGGGGGGYGSLGGNPFVGSDTAGGTGGGGKSGYLAGDRDNGVYTPKSSNYIDAFSGTVNTGSGGGGWAGGEVIFSLGAHTAAGSGGSGIVVIRGTW